MCFLCRWEEHKKMRDVFELNETEIIKKKKWWAFSFFCSIVVYLILVILFLFIHSRNNATPFLITTYILTVLEVSFSFYYLLYKKRRIKRYINLLTKKNDFQIDSFYFAKELDYVIFDYLPFRHLVFINKENSQEYDFYLIASFKMDFIKDKQYKIKHVSSYVYSIGDEK